MKLNALANRMPVAIRFAAAEGRRSLTLEDVQTILKDVNYKDWAFRTYTEDERMILQVRFHDADSETGKMALQSGRKWFLSPWMTKSEIVQTALKAVLTAEEHEARERFQYKGEPIFGPHFDIDDLAGLCRQKRFDVRG